MEFYLRYDLKVSAIKRFIDLCFMESHPDILLDDNEVRELTILKDFLSLYNY